MDRYYDRDFDEDLAQIYRTNSNPLEGVGGSRGSENNSDVPALDRGRCANVEESILLKNKVMFYWNYALDVVRFAVGRAFFVQLSSFLVIFLFIARDAVWNFNQFVGKYLECGIVFNIDTEAGGGALDEDELDAAHEMEYGGGGGGARRAKRFNKSDVMWYQFLERFLKMLDALSIDLIPSSLKYAWAYTVDYRHIAVENADSVAMLDEQERQTLLRNAMNPRNSPMAGHGNVNAAIALNSPSASGAAS